MHPSISTGDEFDDINNCETYPLSDEFSRKSLNLLGVVSRDRLKGPAELTSFTYLYPRILHSLTDSFFWSLTPDFKLNIL